MANQSAIDGMTCLLCMLYHLTKNIELTPHMSVLTNNLTCWFWQSEYLYHALSTASIYNLLFLTYERYLAITKAMTYNHEKIYKRLPLILVLSWVCGLVFSSDIVFFMQVVDYACIFTAHIRFPVLFSIMIYIYIIMHIMLPSLLMLIAYLRMGLVLKNTGFTSKVSSQAQVNLFQTCVLLVITFILMGFYQFVMMVLQIRNVNPDVVALHYHISNSLVLLNATINPFIYCFRYKEFQTRLKEIVCGTAVRGHDNTA